MNQVNQFDFYISCPPGLEPFLASEYHALGLVRKKSQSVHDSSPRKSGDENSGGMEFTGTLDQVYMANLRMRTAGRVTLRMGEFIAITFAELRKKTSKLNWGLFLKPDQKVNVQVTCHKSRLYHSEAVAERVRAGINDHFGLPESKQLSDNESPDSQLILVRFVNDHCTISLDSSGDLLHKRGYRQAVAKAPLRENLAAGLIMAAGWDCTSPLLDPFCGSGTFPIEGALMSQHIPTGINRSFQFMHWANFEKTKWESILSDAKKNITPGHPLIQGFDRDQGAVEMAKANAARAGQKDIIQFNHQALSFLEPPATSGWIITNPPYGVRISQEKDLRDLYARFGSILKQKFTGWTLGLLSADHQLIANMDLGKPEKAISLTNGGLPVNFIVVRI